MHGVTPPGRLGGARVLVVEDDILVRDALAMLLAVEGASVTSVGSGREAAEVIAHAGAFAAVLTDLGLPDVPGDLLIRQILATASRRPRVIVVTGAGETERAAARRAGADVVLSKPVEWKRVLQSVQAACVPGAAA
jgi:CheY-like chemotaxis protein